MNKIDFVKFNKRDFNLYFVADSLEHLEVLRKAYVKNVLVSYPYVKKLDMVKFKQAVKGFNLIIDSGGNTFQRLNQNKPFEKIKIDIRDYVDFINVNKNLFKFCFSLDPFDYNDEDAIKDLEYLAENSTVPVFPVWHQRDSTNQLKEFCQRFRRVAVSTEDVGSLPNLNCPVHLLGCGNVDKLKKYPFASADTAVWNNGTKFGFVYVLDGGRIKRIHYQKEPNRLITYKRNIECCGFSIDDLNDSENRDLANIMTLKHIEKWVNEYYDSLLTNSETNRSKPGPKTHAGKLMASGNSLKHGRFADMNKLAERASVDDRFSKMYKKLIMDNLNSEEEMSIIVKEQLFGYKYMMRRNMENKDIEKIIAEDMDKKRVTTFTLLEKWDKLKKGSGNGGKNGKQ
jgi:hypothetical protein